MRPAAWAAARPRQASATSRVASRQSSRPWASSSAWALPPGTSSITRYGVPSWSPTSWTATTLGWLRRGAAPAPRPTRRAGPAHESLRGLGAVGQRQRQQLERDAPLQQRILGLVHDTHAAAAQLADNAIPPHQVSRARSCPFVRLPHARLLIGRHTPPFLTL